MKIAIILSAVTGPLALVRPMADAFAVPASFARIIAVSSCAPQPAEGQSRGVPSTTVRPGIVTAVISLARYFRLVMIRRLTIGTLNFSNETVGEDTGDSESRT